MAKRKTFRTKADERFAKQDDKKREKERIEYEERQNENQKRQQLEPAWAAGKKGTRWYWVYWNVLSEPPTKIGSALTESNSINEIVKLHGKLPDNRLVDRAALQVHARQNDV